MDKVFCTNERADELLQWCENLNVAAVITPLKEKGKNKGESV